jgi:hypothetical protein
MTKTIVLTARDIELLNDVYKYRYLTFTQLARLHFPSRVIAYRRLQKLVDKKYLKTFHAPNIPERIFFLGSEGAEVVASTMNVTVEDLQWYRYMKAPKDYHFLQHFLAINDFRILITQSCKNSPIELLGFIPEYFGEKTIEGSVKKYIRDKVCDIANHSLEYSHTPDAVFSLRKGSNAVLFFLEIDRGIEKVGDAEKGILKSIVFYLNYLIDGKYQRYEADFKHAPLKTFRALIVTTSQVRLQHLREAVAKLPFNPPHAKRYLWGTVEKKVTQETLFTPIWNSLDVNDTTLYTIG